MEYVYAGLWLVVGLLLIFRFGKEYKLFYAVGAFFLFMAAWWGYGAGTGTEMIEGTRGWVFRGIALVVLIALVPIFVRRMRRERAENGAPQKTEAQRRQDAEDLKWLEEMERQSADDAPGFAWEEDVPDADKPENGAGTHPSAKA